MGHKHVKVAQLVILVQKVKVDEKESLHFLIIRLLAMLQIVECTLLYQINHIWSYFMYFITFIILFIYRKLMSNIFSKSNYSKCCDIDVSIIMHIIIIF
jgi:hypothetical protein